MVPACLPACALAGAPPGAAVAKDEKVWAAALKPDSALLAPANAARMGGADCLLLVELAEALLAGGPGGSAGKAEGERPCPPSPPGFGAEGPWVGAWVAGHVPLHGVLQDAVIMPHGACL